MYNIFKYEPTISCSSLSLGKLRDHFAYLGFALVFFETIAWLVLFTIL